MNLPITDPSKDLPADLLAAILFSLPPAPLPADRKSLILEKVLSSVAADVPPKCPVKAEFTTIRAGTGAWVPITENAEKLVLSDDHTTMSWLVRMQRGARLPPHAHEFGDEECLVLEGSVLLGDTFLNRGDYQVALCGTSHGEVYSEEGCLLFVRSPSESGRHIGA